MHWPAPTNETKFPATVHTPIAPDEMVTANPEVEDAATA